MMEDIHRTANLLGAAVLGLHDELRKAVESRSGLGGETPAAVIAIGHYPGMSNDTLSRLLGLTHTGAVRLVDRVVEEGLVERRTGLRDRRSVALHLTAKGEALRGEILAAREAAFLPLLSSFSACERKALAPLLEKLLTAVSRDDAHKLRICRLCDSEACTHCPILVPIESDDGERPSG